MARELCEPGLTQKETRVHCKRPPATIRRIRAPLSASLNEARELDLIATDAAKVRLIVLGEPRTSKPKTITLAERDRAHGVRIGDALGA